MESVPLKQQTIFLKKQISKMFQEVRERRTLKEDI